MALKMAIVFGLLAMAATVTHARLDLFQMPFSKNQQPINHGGAEVLTKSELIPMQAEKSGFIPYPECIKNCDECTICTLIWPIEKALCLCVNHTDAHHTNNKNYKMPSAIESSEMPTKLELVALSKWLPYPECIKQCDSCTICTRVYPIELAWCVCVNNPATHNKQPQLLPASIIQTSEEEVIKVESRGKSDLMGSGEMKWPGGIPYPICIQICKKCACTRIYPIELATCICLDKHPSKSSRALEVK